MTSDDILQDMAFSKRTILDLELQRQEHLDKINLAYVHGTPEQLDDEIRKYGEHKVRYILHNYKIKEDER